MKERQADLETERATRDELKSVRTSTLNPRLSASYQSSLNNQSL